MKSTSPTNTYSGPDSFYNWPTKKEFVFCFSILEGIWNKYYCYDSSKLSYIVQENSFRTTLAYHDVDVVTMACVGSKMTTAIIHFNYLSI